MGVVARVMSHRWFSRSRAHAPSFQALILLHGHFSWRHFAVGHSTTLRDKKPRHANTVTGTDATLNIMECGSSTPAINDVRAKVFGSSVRRVASSQAAVQRLNFEAEMNR